MTSDRQLLQSFLDAIHPLPEVDRERLLAGFQEVSFPRRHLITSEGQTERYLYFVLEGIQRSYYLKDGKEYTIAFTYPPSFSGIPESFLTQRPSRYFLETLTPSRLLRLPFERLEELTRNSHPVERLLRKACEGVLVGLVERHYELLALSIEERFRTFAARSPHLFNLIPHKYLANYLGMDPTNFSKLLNSIRF